MGATSAAARPRASFGIQRAHVPRVIARARMMSDAMVAAVALFPEPTVSMAAFLVLILALEEAQHGMGTRARGLATARNVRRDVLWTAMESLRAYVQSLADGMSAANGAALIEAAGLLVAAGTGHGKPVLQAKRTAMPGVVWVIANASILTGKPHAKRVTFRWQWSADEGATWNDAPSTPLADTRIGGLALVVEHLFRVSVTVSRTTGPWSQPVRLLVHG
jgi:hypothetical protein